MKIRFLRNATLENSSILLLTLLDLVTMCNSLYQLDFRKFTWPAMADKR